MEAFGILMDIVAWAAPVVTLGFVIHTVAGERRSRKAEQGRKS